MLQKFTVLTRRRRLVLLLLCNFPAPVARHRRRVSARWRRRRREKKDFYSRLLGWWDRDQFCSSASSDSRTLHIDIIHSLFLSLSLPKFYSCVRVLFLTRKCVILLCLLCAIVFSTPQFIINGIVAHDAREEERYTKYFYNNNGWLLEVGSVSYTHLRAHET